MIRKLPNYISIARMICVPILIYWIVLERMDWAFWGFLAAGVSDALDGFIARRFDARSTLGAILDPLADKALLVGAFATLGWLGHLPLWLMAVVIGRDVLIVAAVSVLQYTGRKISVRPIIVSKLNTVLQISLILLILGTGIIYTPSQEVLQGLFIATAATTVISFLLYIRIVNLHLDELNRGTRL